MRNDEFEHKTVHLRFGQRIGTVLLDRVLRRQNEEGFVQFSGNPHDGYGMFLHGLQERRLRFRRRTIDLVRKDDIAENRSRLETELRISVLILYNNIRPRYVRGHQIGG